MFPCSSYVDHPCSIAVNVDSALLRCLLSFLNWYLPLVLVFLKEVTTFRSLFSPASRSILTLAHGVIGNGSMMIEVVPFYHSIAGIIAASITVESGNSVVATTMFAFALSSILTGMVFFLLGYLKLGSLSEFFPRHILVGCIGGVGFFLLQTGVEISAQIDESVGIDAGIIEHLFDNEVLPLWVSIIMSFSALLLGLIII